MTEYCVICGRDTSQTFNIHLEEKPICERCERSIVLQSIDEKYRTLKVGE